MSVYNDIGAIAMKLIYTMSEKKHPNCFSWYLRWKSADFDKIWYVGIMNKFGKINLINYRHQLNSHWLLQNHVMTCNTTFVRWLYNCVMFIYRTLSSTKGWEKVKPTETQRCYILKNLQKLASLTNKIVNAFSHLWMPAIVKPFQVWNIYLIGCLLSLITFSTNQVHGLDT